MKRKIILSTIGLLVAPIALAGLFNVTNVQTNVKADFEYSNIKDPKLDAKMKKWAKEDQTPEFKARGDKLMKKYHQEGKEFVAITIPLGIETYKQYTPEEMNIVQHKINNYKDVFGVPGMTRKSVSASKQIFKQKSAADKKILTTSLSKSIPLNQNKINKLKAKLSHKKHLSNKTKQKFNQKIKVLNGYIKDAQTKLKNLKQA